MSTSAVADQLRRAQHILDRERISEKAAEVKRDGGIVLIHYEDGRGAYGLEGLDAEWVWSGSPSHGYHTHSLVPDDGKALAALAHAVADILRNNPPGKATVSPCWPSITPWPENLAVPVPAGDPRVLLNGEPCPVPIRILSEENYQIARAAVNRLAGVTE